MPRREEFAGMRAHRHDGSGPLSLPRPAGQIVEDPPMAQVNAVKAPGGEHHVLEPFFRFSDVFNDLHVEQDLGGGFLPSSRRFALRNAE